MDGYRHTVLDTIEAFLDSCPDIPEELDVKCSNRQLTRGIGGECMTVTIGKETFDVTVQIVVQPQ